MKTKVISEYCFLLEGVFEIVFGDVGLAENGGKRANGDLFVIGDDDSAEFTANNAAEFDMTTFLGDLRKP